MNGYILGISRGHNAAVCLLKDGEIIFSIEEERLSRQKYDGGPYAGMVKVLEYTDKIDYLVISHTQPDDSRVDFSGDTVYAALARKLRLIDSPEQIIDMHRDHHKMHAACAFYRSGFDKASTIIVDGAGTFIDINLEGRVDTVWEVETIFECSYPSNLIPKYKHMGGRGPFSAIHIPEYIDENQNSCEVLIDESAGITKAYEAVTQYCGWSPIEAGKTMGLFPYGKENNKIPKIYDNDNGFAKWTVANRNLIIPTYPNGAVVNSQKYDFLNNHDSDDVTLLENRRDMAYAIQTQSQQQVLDLIMKALEINDTKNIVISGGYGLNCVANYWYLDQLKDIGVNIYVEPISNDAGTAIGAALYYYHLITSDSKIRERADSLYLGPKYTYSNDYISSLSNKYNATITDNITYKDIVRLLREKNIVTMFQGRSENGPRALGNRTVMFDPTFEDGKDFVNSVKRREYFRPFAASVLEEDTKDWFDLRGMDNSPHMMYAVNCYEGIAEKIPSVIHIDGTCRIQTVTKIQNEHYYNLILAFKEETGVPLLFNTSFNLGGDPLVETLDDAFNTLKKSDIEYLFLPEYNLLVYIKNI